MNVSVEPGLCLRAEGSVSLGRCKHEVVLGWKMEERIRFGEAFNRTDAGWGRGGGACLGGT